MFGLPLRSNTEESVKFVILSHQTKQRGWWDILNKSCLFVFFRTFSYLGHKGLCWTGSRRILNIQERFWFSFFSTCPDWFYNVFMCQQLTVKWRPFERAMWETEGVKAMGTYWRGAKKKPYVWCSFFAQTHENCRRFQGALSYLERWMSSICYCFTDSLLSMDSSKEEIFVTLP